MLFRIIFSIIAMSVSFQENAEKFVLSGTLKNDGSNIAMFSFFGQAADRGWTTQSITFSDLGSGFLIENFVKDNWNEFCYPDMGYCGGNDIEYSWYAQSIAGQRRLTSKFFIDGLYILDDPWRKTIGYISYQGSRLTYNFNGMGEVSYSISVAGGVPEPASWIMLIIGFGGIAAGMRWRTFGSFAATQTRSPRSAI